MTISLHTGVRTATVSTAWTAWDVPLRLVVTDPWALHKARLLVEELVGGLAAAPRGERVAEILGARAVEPRAFPYGITAAPHGADVHRAAPAPWQQALAASLGARDGWRLECGASATAVIAQRCAELVAEVTSCGALVAFGDDIATSGLAPVGGWRVELRDAPSVVVAVDGGAISSVSSVRPGRGSRADLGPVVAPTWRSVAVAAADAPVASAACTGALLRGDGAPAWLAELGLPALLVEPAGAAHVVGQWPLPV